MFLTPEEIFRITGRRQRAGQKKVLAAKGYVFEEDGFGWPLVSRHAAEKRFGSTKEAERRGPDTAALAALMGAK